MTAGLSAQALRKPPSENRPDAHLERGMTSLTTSLKRRFCAKWIKSWLDSDPDQLRFSRFNSKVEESESFSLIAKGNGQESLPISTQWRIGRKEVEISRNFFRLFGFSAQREHLRKSRPSLRVARPSLVLCFPQVVSLLQCRPAQRTSTP